MRISAFFWLGLTVPLALSAQETYWGVPLTAEAARSSHPQVAERFGVPFIPGTLAIQDLGSARVDLGGNSAARIFLSGMTYAKPTPWAHARDYSMRFFVGDELGRIRLEYADGSAQIFPLILGESIWWGKLFRDYPEPFSSDPSFREALAESFRLYPATPVGDGNYLAVITPKPVPIRSFVLEASPIKWGVPVIDGITVESASGSTVRGAIPLPQKDVSPELETFIGAKSLLPLGDTGNPKALNDLRHALYTSDEDFGGHVAESLPPGYAGPKVTFKGSIYAEILANAFPWNLQDMAGKVDANGFYHTSSKNSQSWGGYSGIGTFAPNHGTYYGDSWSRDMGRSLQELAELGYTRQTAACADYCLRMARLWEQDPELKFKGQVLPPHWGRIANNPGWAPPFENDGHGLVMLGLYKTWQRLPDRDRWLRAHWSDVKAAGDWILWQFAHPDISGAADGLLHTTGEFSSAKGFSIYADDLCMEGLNALAQMADSIGETGTAGHWRGRAAKMRAAIADRYVFDDPHFGRVWTTEDARYADKTTVLGPLLLLADSHGFAPEDDDPRWRPVNEATFRRLVANHLPPLGFYGRTMGYGQGFDTQSALLLDRMRDASRMLDWAARQIYDPKYKCYLVPEGCDIDPTNGHFWYKLGDLGNGVQEAEIIKALRLMLGVDDTQPGRLQFFPRMPYGWTEMAVDGIPVLYAAHGSVATTTLHYRLERTTRGMALAIGAAQPLGPLAMRLGPFAQRPAAADIRVNGSSPAGAAVESSGDSWWVRFNVSLNR